MSFSEPAVSALLAAANSGAVCAGLAQQLTLAAAPHRHSDGNPVFSARAEVLIELFYDAFEAAKAAGLRAASIAVYLNTHHAVVQALLAGASETASRELFDRLMVDNTVSSFEENAEVVASQAALEGDGVTAKYSLFELKKLSRHAKMSGILAVYSMYQHALTQAQRVDQVECAAAVETPYPSPPLAQAHLVVPTV